MTTSTPQAPVVFMLAESGLLACDDDDCVPLVVLFAGLSLITSLPVLYMPLYAWLVASLPESEQFINYSTAFMLVGCLYVSVQALWVLASLSLWKLARRRRLRHDGAEDVKNGKSKNV